MNTFNSDFYELIDNFNKLMDEIDNMEYNSLSEDHYNDLVNMENSITEVFFDYEDEKIDELSVISEVLNILNYLLSMRNFYPYNWYGYRIINSIYDLFKEFYVNHDSF